MRPILFSLGRLNFYSYGFFTALGFIAGGAVIDFLAKKKKLITGKHREYFLIDGLLFSLIVAIIASRIGYLLLYSLVFPVEPFDFAHSLLAGGFVFYIGLIAGLATLAWWLRKNKTPILPWFDITIVGIFTGLTISEIGGYLNDGQIVHLASLLGNSILAGFTYQLVLAEKKVGQTFFTGLFLLLLLFFFLGFWQIERVQWLGLTLTQWASLVGMGAMGFSRRWDND